MSTKPTSEKLQQVLWDTLKGLQDGSVNAQKANAVSSNIRTSCSLVKLELQTRKLLGKKPTAKTVKFIS